MLSTTPQHDRALVEERLARASDRRRRPTLIRRVLGAAGWDLPPRTRR